MLLIATDVSSWNCNWMVSESLTFSVVFGMLTWTMLRTHRASMTVMVCFWNSL